MMLMHVMVGTRVMRYRGLIVAVEDRRDGADDKQDRDAAGDDDSDSQCCRVFN